MPPILPTNWYIYVVANISGCHRSLVLASLTNRDQSRVEGNVVISLCERAKAVFENPSHRVAIASELGLAELYYEQDIESTPLRPSSNSGLLVLSEEGLRRRSPVLYRSFPFLTTCLLLAVNAARSSSTSLTFRCPRSTFNTTNYSDGLIVFDITCIENIGYGIVASDVMGSPKSPTPEQAARPAELRIMPLSASEFADKFGIRDAQQPLRDLEGTPVIMWPTLKYIWPEAVPEGNVASPASSTTGPRPLKDMIMTTFVKDALETRYFEASRITEAARRVPFFRRALRVKLEQCKDLRSRPSVAPLVAVAFERETHLNLVKLKGITTDALRAALEMKELEQVTSISICAEHYPDLFVEPEFVNMLLLPRPNINTDLAGGDRGKTRRLLRPKLYDLYICRLPHRTYGPGKEFFRQIWHHRDRLNRYVFFSDAYSAGLATDNSWPPSKDECEVYFVDEGFLTPSKTIGGFFKWLAHRDGNFLDFVSGAPVGEASNSSRITVSPIPNFRPIAAASRESQCCPGSWHLLISRTRTAELGWHVRYAFVQVLADPARFMSIKWKRREFMPGMIATYSMKEFLKATTKEAPVSEKNKSIDEQLAAITTTVRTGADATHELSVEVMDTAAAMIVFIEMLRGESA